MKLRKVVLLALLALSLAATACGAKPAPTSTATIGAPPGDVLEVTSTPEGNQRESPDYWPTESWRTSTPEEQGMDAHKLEQMMAFIDAHEIAIDSVIVVRHGYIVWEEYRNGYNQQRAHHLQSVTKSFTSTLIGIAIHEGLIENVGQRLVDFFPDQAMANMDARKQRITLEHLLTMSEGMDWHEIDYPYTDKRNTLGQMWVSGDAVQHVLDRPMAREPGGEWAYNSGTSIIMGGILEQVTGGDVSSFAREYLFDPIGIGQVTWSKTTGNHYHTDGGLYMTPRDMARLGFLMLNNGTWDGREIVSPEWVVEASRTHYRTTSGQGYGYQWWTWPGTGVYAATGHYEQKIYVVPEANMVVVFTANIADEDPHPTDGMLFRYIRAACTDLPYEELYKRYAKYGFSFDYGLGTTVLETPLPGRETVSDASGTVQFRFDGYPLELNTVIWDTVEADPDLEAYLDGFFASVAQQPGLELARGELAEAAKGDHEMVYQTFRLTEQGVAFSGVIGVWVCSEAGRAYAFSTITLPEMEAQELLATFQERLEAFVCHQTD